MSIIHRPLSRIIISTILLPLAPQAFSQDNFQLEEIIVTAQKREQSLQDVPVSVQAISGTALENAGVQEFEDLVNVSPSLGLQSNLSPFQKSVYIRGVGTTVNDVTVEPSVSVVLDGVVLARQGQFFSDLADIERVEVLRGPQSTLFGKNASAGLISVVTKKPSYDETDGKVAIDSDEYGETRLKGTYGAPISENLAYRISGNYSYAEDSHIENVNEGGESFEGDESWTIRSKLLWSITPEVEALFIADYSKVDAAAGARVVRDAAPSVVTATLSNPTANLVPGEDNRKVDINDPNRTDITDWGLSAEVNWQLEDHTVTSISAYRVWDIYDSIDIDSNGVDVPLSSVPGQGTPSLRATVDGPKESSQWSQEVRIQSDHSGDLQYVVGAFYWGTAFDSDTSERRQFCFVPPAPLYSPLCPAVAPLRAASRRQVNEADTEYYALFGQLDYSITDELSATLGVRVQHDEFEWNITQLGVLELGDIPLGQSSGDGSVSNTETTGKAVLQYALDNESNVYVSYSRGYKGPGGDLSATFTDPLEPETVDAYELGYKTRLIDNRLNINLSLFSQEFKNTQTSFFDEQLVAFAPTNAGETRQRGVEFDSQFAATSNLFLNASVTYLDAEYLDFSTECYVNDPTPGCVSTASSKDVSGERLIFAPELKAVLGGRYTSSFTDTLNGFVQLDYRWQSEVQYSANQDPETEQDAYGITDLSFGIEEASGRYALKFYVRNVFDESYVTNIATFLDASGADNVVVQFVPKSADRYVGGSFEYSF